MEGNKPVGAKTAIEPARPQKHVLVNEAIDRLDNVEASLRRVLNKIMDTPQPVSEDAPRDCPGLADTLDQAPDKIDRHSDRCYGIISDIEATLF